MKKETATVREKKSFGGSFIIRRFLKVVWEYGSVWVWLFRDFIRLHLSKGYDWQIEIEIKTGKHWWIYGNIDFAGFEKSCSFNLCSHRTCPFGIGLHLFGLNLNFHWGDGRHDGYDEHLDKYYDYEPLADAHPDWDFQKLDALIPYSVRKPEVFKEYYVSRRIHVYSNDTANNKHALAVELALPFLRYMKISFKRPWGYAEWFGIDFFAHHAIGIVFSLFKHDLKIVFAKNSLDRSSNLSTEKALDRFLTLNGNRKIPLEEIRWAYSSNKEACRLFFKKIRERKKRD
ncbi:MAG: hypothetical protein J5787_05090 [Alphaproteobacteria bacterium]|nr:hypothetical protein [Alphaproteobacteria bacterium]